MKNSSCSNQGVQTSDVRCPRHNVPLAVENRIIKAVGKKYRVMVGRCPECRNTYISHAIFPASREFSIGSVRYQYLDTLNCVAKEQMAKQAKEINERCKHKEMVRDAARKKNEHLIAAQRARERQKTEEQKVEEYIAKIELAREERKIEIMREQLLCGGKNFAFHAKIVVRDAGITTYCPEDDERLIHVMRADGPGIGFMEGYCCVRCGRLYLPWKSKTGNTYAPPTALPRRSKKPYPKFTGFETEHLKEKTKEDSTDNFKKEMRFDTSAVTLYICKGLIACHRKNHTIVAATGVLADSNGVPIRINVNYCCQCKQYFIDYDEYFHYQKRYGKIMGNFTISHNGLLAPPLDTMASESVMHLCGYTVNQADGLTAMRRHLILAYLMDHGIMGKPDILSHLDFFIRANGSRRNMDVAVSRWSEDANWVRSYHIDDQHHAAIQSIKKYR